MNSQPLNLVQVCEDVAYWCWRPGDRGRDLASFRESVARHRRSAPEASAEHEEGLPTALLGLSVCLAGLAGHWKRSPPRTKRSSRPAPGAGCRVPASP